MNIKAFNVEYENNGKDEYFAGQTVNGFVNITLKNPTKIRVVTLIGSGKAKVSWREFRDNNQGSELTGSVLPTLRFLSDVHKYIKNETILWGQSSDEHGSIMEAGTHRLPFHFEIPCDCPSSFESSHGHVRYYCKAVISVPWKTNSTTKRAFTVVAQADLNNCQGLNFEKFQRKTKTVHGVLGFTTSGQIEYELKLPRIGYVPGEVIPFEITVDNNSTTGVNHASVTFVQNVTVISTGMSKDTTTSAKKIFGAKRGDIQPKQKLLWKNDSLTIPLLPPTLTSCRVLKIEYYLELAVGLKWSDRCEPVILPVIIGNIPFRSIAENSTNVVQPITNATNAGFFSSEPIADLPSYDEAVFGESKATVTAF